MEACALLNTKMGKYYEGVTQYMKVITKQVNLKMLKYELYEAREKGISSSYPIHHAKYMPHCTKLDHILKTVTKICVKYSKEVDIGKEE